MVEQSKLLSAEQSALGDAIAGASAGLFGLLIMYPLDTYKSRKQISNQSELKNLYDGLGIGLISEAAQQAAYYFFYSWLKKKWMGKSQSTIIALGVGAVAGVLNMALTSPLSTIHARMQTARFKREMSIIDHIKEIWKKEGILGFWSGFSTSVILVINPSITFYCFESLKKYAAKFTSLGSGWLFLYGALAKLIATVITYPLILAKTRLQTDKEKVYKGILDLYVKIVRANGFKGLYSGMNSKLLQTCISSAIKFMMKDLFDGLAFFIVLKFLASKKTKTN
jgi:solute carrier family 25 (peroxisomal adenine nucleotide transporter), member 17